MKKRENAKEKNTVPLRMCANIRCVVHNVRIMASMEREEKNTAHHYLHNEPQREKEVARNEMKAHNIAAQTERIRYNS